MCIGVPRCPDEAPHLPHKLPWPAGHIINMAGSHTPPKWPFFSKIDISDTSGPWKHHPCSPNISTRLRRTTRSFFPRRLRPFRFLRFSSDRVFSLRRTVGWETEITVAAGVQKAPAAACRCSLHATCERPFSSWPHTVHVGNFRRFSSASPLGSAPPQRPHLAHLIDAMGAPAR